MIQIILSKDEADLIGELRACHHSLVCILKLFKRGKEDASAAINKMEPFFDEAERLWGDLQKEGL